MGAHAIDSEVNDEPVLQSSYPQVPIPTLTTKSACEFLINSAKKHAEAGRTNWLSNTVTGETLTFADVDPMSRKIASAMNKRGMVKGDVALYLTSDVTRIFTYVLGVWRLGGCMYSSYPEDTQDMLLLRIQESKAKFIVCDPVSVPQCLAATKQVDWSVEIFVFGKVDGCTSIDELFEDDGLECPEKIDAELDDPLLILCTSGTTGKSKGAIYSNRSVLAFTLGTAGIPRNEKPAFLMLRCTHVLGILFPIRNLYVGVWSVMMHQITKENIFKAVDQYKPIIAFGFATFLVLLAIDPEAHKYDRSSLEVIITGGMVLTAKFYNAMMTLPNIKAVLNGYGMTECGALTTTIDLAGLQSNGIRLIPNVPPLSVGKLYPNTALKVLDLDTGRALGPNERGEVAVRSPILCSGYWNRPEETANTFKNGWLKTGDLGYYDENGFVYIVDRIKETFKYFNCHISPAEIEEVILTHPAVAEVSVFGVPDPDGGDHIPRAVVVAKPGIVVTPGEIRAFTDDQVAAYKQLRGGIFIVAGLPRGKTGKVMRSMVATMPLPSPAF